MPNMTMTLVGDVICQLSSFKEEKAKRRFYCSTMYIQNGHMIGLLWRMDGYQRQIKIEMHYVHVHICMPHACLSWYYGYYFNEKALKCKPSALIFGRGCAKELFARVR